MLDPGKEKRVATMIFVGVALAILSIFVFMAGARSGLMAVGNKKAMGPLYVMIGSITMAVVGVGLVVMGILSGSMQNRKLNRSTKVEVAQRCMALARFCTDSDGNMILEDDADVVPGAKFYIRMAMENGARAEFKTRYEVYMTVGEGQWGMAEFQGDWLGRWTPTTPPTQTKENPYA